MKTKPTQHSVNALRGMGIQPDFIVCRSEGEVDEDIKSKLALHCDVKLERIISLETLDTIYAVPIELESQELSRQISEFLNLNKKKANLDDWNEMVEAIRSKKQKIKIGIVGKYVDLRDSYLSVKEALLHAGISQNLDVEIVWISSDVVETKDLRKSLSRLSGVIVPGGFGPRGIEGMIECAKYSRINGLPYLGLCLGMQVMVIEFARSKLDKNKANSLEFDQETPDPVIGFLPGQETLKGTGGSMRLGNYPCVLRENSIAFQAYGKPEIQERHRHRYEVNNEYKNEMENKGLIATGLSPDGTLVEIMEMKNHPFMIGSQFHPEFRSRPNRPHPLFREFVKTAKDTLVTGKQIQMMR